MKGLVWRSALVVLILTPGNLARAPEWFVAQKDPVADDRNPGTESRPFKTIQPAVDAARSGDTIYVKEGLYSDRVRLRGFGRPGWLDRRRPGPGPAQAADGRPGDRQHALPHRARFEGRRGRAGPRGRSTAPSGFSTAPNTTCRWNRSRSAAARTDWA